LIYKYDKETTFDGGNEYFYYDNKDIRASTNTISRTEMEDLYHNYLFTNTVQEGKPYTYNPDINGSFLVRNSRGEKASIDAEYVWVHFALNYFEDIGDGEIHIYGGFNDFTPDASTRMEYDSRLGNYKLKRLFKQGFYNYKYVLIKEDGTMDYGAIDGNFDKTENEYTVVVYYRAPGDRFDRVIGVGRGNAENITN